MSILGVLATLSLLFGLAIAQISAATCTFTGIYDWAFNSLNQSPCTVAAYLQSSCNGGSFTIGPLLSGQEYLGPSSSSDDSDLCKCNTVVYSLTSACGACQAATWIDWPQWAHNCTTVLSPGTFPNPVPQGTSVPQWALADVTREDLALWDSIQAMDIGDAPEIGPGQLIGTNSSGSGAGPTGTNTANPTDFPFTTLFPSGTSLPTSGDSPTSGTSKSKSSRTAAIIGGAVGGAAVIAVAIITIGLLSRRRHRTPPPGPYMVDLASQPLNDPQKPISDAGTTAPSSTVETPVMPMKAYDPNDVTTFPGYQEPRHVPDMPTQPAQPPSQPYHPRGNTMANVRTTMPQGYKGLPIV